MSLDLAVIIPVYNEEKIIPKVLKDWSDELRQLGISFEIRAYNDGSKDNTSIVLKNLEGEIPNLVVINKPNSGHGPTILKGYREGSLDAEWIFQVDSDNEMPASYFERLWNNREDYDFLIGWRKDRKQPISRKVISLFSRITVWSFYGKGVSDVNSPYRLMRSSCFKELYSQIPEDTFAPNLIVSGFTALKHLRIFQTEVPHTNRKTGEVSIQKLKLLRVALKSYRQSITFRFKKYC